MKINTQKPYVLFFEERSLPPTTNAMSSMPWQVKHKHREAWDNVVMFHALKTGAPPKPLARAKLSLIRRSSSEPDFDGLVSSFKWVIDALITNGILKNDKRENVGIPEYAWEKVKPKEGSIVVSVTEIILDE